MAALSSQHHSFDIALASQYGVECAILIHHFQHWIRINRRGKRNIRDGKCWTYQSRKEIQLHFPYWSYDEVKYLCEKLENEGVLITANFNKSKFDKTLWYAFVDEKAFQVDEESSKNVYEGKKCPSKGKNAHGEGKSAQPIPDTINTDTKTNNQPPNPLPRGKADKPPLRGFGSFVKLKEGEYESFCQKYGSRRIDELLEEINDWIASGRGDPYDDYAAGIRTWIRKRKWEPLEPVEAPKTISLPKLPENPRDILIRKNQEWLDNFVVGGKSIRYFQRNDKVILEKNHVTFSLSPAVRIEFDDENFQESVMLTFDKLLIKIE
jgi:hypothetical protein